MFNTKISKVVLLTLALAFVFAVALMQTGAMAQSNDGSDELFKRKMAAKLSEEELFKRKMAAKSIVDELIEAKGTCKEIAVDVKAGKLAKGQKVEVPYQIYWIPLNKKTHGKLVAKGKATVTKDQVAQIRYVPTTNPNGPLGYYDVKAQVVINSKSVKNLNTTVRIYNCK